MAATSAVRSIRLRIGALIPAAAVRWRAATGTVAADLVGMADVSTACAVLKRSQVLANTAAARLPDVATVPALSAIIEVP